MKRFGTVNPEVALAIDSFYRELLSLVQVRRTQQNLLYWTGQGRAFSPQEGATIVLQSWWHHSLNQLAPLIATFLFAIVSLIHWKAIARWTGH